MPGGISLEGANGEEFSALMTRDSTMAARLFTPCKEHAPATGTLTELHTLLDTTPAGKHTLRGELYRSPTCRRCSACWRRTREMVRAEVANTRPQRIWRITDWRWWWQQPRATKNLTHAWNVRLRDWCEAAAGDRSD